MTNDHPQLERLAETARNICSYKMPGEWSHERLKQLILNRMNQMDVWHDSGMLDPHKLEQDFHDHFSALLEVADLKQSLHSRGIYTVWCMAEGIQRTVHPEDWVIAIEWMFGSWEGFLNQYLDPTSYR